MKIDIKKLNERAIVPTRGSRSAAGSDLYACIPEGSVTVPAGKTVKIGTGLAIAVPEGYFGAVFARSGLAAKGLRPANCVGVADSDYRGEYIVALHNDTDEDMTVADGDRVAQLVVLPYLDVEFNETDELDSTERGSGGFGSTGR